MFRLKHVRGIPIALAMLVAVTAPRTGWAALGGDVTTVQDDAVRMKGSLRSTVSPSYTVHEISASGGTLVREYISPQGKVFGVSWRGPVLPDFQQLLSTYYSDFQQEVRSRDRRIRGPVVVQKPNVVIQSAGHMRNFMGRAYLPGSLPAGVTPGEIQ